MAIDANKLKALRINRLKYVNGYNSVNHVEHLDSAGAKLVMSGILVPGAVVTADVSAAGVRVLTGSILRIEASADQYVAFGPKDIAAVTSSTSPALKLKSGDVALVVATDDYVRSSAVFTRLEVIEN